MARTIIVDSELLEVPEIREASEQAAYTPAELAAYEAYWDAVSTEKSLLSDRYQQGKVENQIATAKRMLLKGIALPLIVEITGLSETEICELECVNVE